MNVRTAAGLLMRLYPRIFFACHTRHVRDSRTRRVLSAHQASILDHLDDVEPTTLGGLALHTGVTPSTMSLSIERLVRQGYVRRTRDPRDGRRVGLRLTPAGVRIKESKSVLDARRVRAMLRRLSPVERAEAIRGLGLLAEAAQREMHHKSLYGLRGPAEGGRGRAKTGDAHVEVDSDHRRGSDRAGAAGGADRVADSEAARGR